MYYNYVFVRDYGNYLWPVSIEAINPHISEILKPEQYNFAIRIQDSAVKLIELARIEGAIPLIKKFDLDKKHIVTTDDIVIFSKDEFKKLILKIIDIDEDKIDIDDEDIQNEYIFEKHKDEILKTLLAKWFPSISVYELVKIIKYLEYWGILFNNGFIITDENKEDVFIEIIEKDDDKLLETLEKLLEARESFAKFDKYFELYSVLKDKLDFMTYWDYDNLEEALEDLNNIYNEYKDKYDSEIHVSKKDLELFYKIKNEYLRKKLPKKSQEK